MVIGAAVRVAELTATSDILTHATPSLCAALAASLATLATISFRSVHGYNIDK